METSGRLVVSRVEMRYQWVAFDGARGSAREMKYPGMDGEW